MQSFIRNKAIILLEVLILIYLLYRYISLPIVFDFKHLQNTLIISGIALLLYILKSENFTPLKGQYLTLSLIFLLGFIPTMFQYYFLFAIGDVDDISLSYFLDYRVVNKSATLSAIALVSYLIGNMSYNQKYISEKNQTNRSYSSNLMQTVSIFLFVIFFVTIDKTYFRGNYGEISNTKGLGYITSYAQMYMQMFIMGAISIITWKYSIQNGQSKTSFIKYVKQYNVLFLIVIIVYSILVLMSGDRGPILSTLFLFIIGYLLIIERKIKLTEILLLGSIAILFFFFLGFFRATDYGLGFAERFDLAISMINNKNSALLFSSTDEFARVIRSQHAIIMYVDEFGLKYLTPILYSLLGLIPGLGILFTSITGIKQSDIKSSNIATNYMNADHGMGTTCVADLYLSFGVITVVAFMFFLGYMFRKIEVKAYTKNHKFIYWLSYLVLMGISVSIGRDSAITPFRIIIYTFIFVVISDYIERKFKSFKL